MTIPCAHADQLGYPRWFLKIRADANQYQRRFSSASPRFLRAFIAAVWLFPLPVLAATAPVGATPGAFSVSPSGAATYSIPLAVPPGTNGLAPQLSLHYNSQGGNGLLGMGWSLGGLSVIHRCGATIAIDGFKGGVNYDANDRFCLDGERLIFIGGSEYRTQHESWQKIVFFGNAINPTSFTVTTKDGTIREYGATNDSRIRAVGQSNVRLWALNKIQDLNGNYLTIGYNNNPTDYTPAFITYTGNATAGLSPYNTVNFEYGPRTDFVSWYEGGSVVQTTQRVTRITAYAGTVLMRAYNLGYDNNGAVGRSRLTSVQECGTDGVCLPPTAFGWQNGSTGFNAASQWIQHYDSEPAQVQYADVNGDGKADSLSFNTFASNVAWISPSVSTGFSARSSWVSYSPPTPAQMQYVDVNGDGKADALYTDIPGNRVLVSLSTVVFLPNGNISGNIFSAPVEWANFSAYGTPLNPVIDPAQVQYADMDGDGRADLIYQAWNNAFRVGLSNGMGFSALAVWFQHSGLPAAGQAQYADVNGDGKIDLIYQDNNNYFFVSLSTGTGFTVPAPWVQHGGSFTAGQAHDADVNGDGKADLIFQGNDGQLWVSLSTGAGFTAPAAWAQPATSFQPDQVQYTDANGDGMADVLYLDVNDNSIWVYLSTGTGFLPGTIWGQSVPSSWGPIPGAPVGSRLRYADVSGDGLPDALYFDAHRTNNVAVSTTKGVPPDLLTSIVNGLGVQTNVSYKPLTDSTVYTKQIAYYGAAYPYQDVQNTTHVVSQSTQSNGLGGVNTTGYQYAGLKKHLTANTSLGFQSILATDVAGITSTYYLQVLDGTEGSVSQSWRSTPGGVPVHELSNTWTPVNLGSGRTLALLSDTSEGRLDPNIILSYVTRATTTYSNFDSYFNPQTIVVSTNDGFSKTTYNTYTNDTTNWYLGQLFQSQVTAIAPGQPAQTRTSGFTYDTLGRLASEVIEPNSSTLWLKSVYAYDAFGNRITKTVSGPDILTRDEYTLTFDPRGQFVTTRKNALNHTESLLHDPRNGLVVNHTDPNGLLTLRSYDGFGRKTFEHRAGSPATTINYGAWANGLYVQTTTTGAGQNYVYSDILGRPVQTNTQGFGGNWIYKETSYDNLGRVISVSHPYFLGETKHYTTYTYDILGRALTITEPGQGPRTTATAYNGLTTTTTNPLYQAKTTVKNSQGQVVTVTDNAGAQSYIYDSLGNLTSVTDVAGNVTAMTYDLRDRKTSIRDPDMGTWSYTYNVLGELVSQKDAKGQKASMTYDKLGRMTSRALPPPDGFSYWTYDTAANGKGKLAAFGNGGASETYVYDTLSRVSSQTTSIGGVAYTTGYTYDANSRPLTLTYPVTGFKLHHVYDAVGHLTEVRQDNATGLRYWKADSFDAHGRLTQETYSNNLTSQRAYDHGTGDLQFIMTGTGANPTAIQNSSYSFDALDNLTGRSWWDDTANRSETFGYDNLNRLIQVTGPASKTYAHAQNGNLTYKSDVGTYSYPTNGIRPHAVTATLLGATTTSYAYDANGNLTTGNGRTLTYTSFNKPKTIANASGTTTLTYDANHHRIIKAAPSGTTTYIGKHYEKLVSGATTTQKHYLYAGHNLIGAYSTFNNGTSNTSNTRYFHTDHLGSIEVITHEWGGVVQRLSYDSFGKRRNVNGTDATAITAMTTRGYTKHEHDDEVNLINMNAREYDPLLGRFISPDTIIPGATNSQSFNRYSYVNNNPLSRIDPTGHGLRKWAKRTVKKYGRTIVAVTAGFYGGFGLAGANGWGALGAGISGGTIAGGIAGGNLKSAAYGGLTGGAFGYVGSLNLSYGQSIGAHAFTGGVTSEISGGDFRSGALGAGFKQFAAPIIYAPGGMFGQTVVAGTVGGLGSALGGGDFGNGFVSGTFSHAFAYTRDTRAPLSEGKLKTELGDNGYTVGYRPLRFAFGVMILDVPGGFFETNNLQLAHSEFAYRYGGSDTSHFGFSSHGVGPDGPNGRWDADQYRFAPIQHGLTVDPASVARNIPGFTTGDAYRFFTNNCQCYVRELTQRVQ